MLTEGKEWEEAVSDVSPEDQAAVRDLAREFFEVFFKSVDSINAQMFKDYEPTPEEMNAIPRSTLYIPADIPSIDVYPLPSSLISGHL